MDGWEAVPADAMASPEDEWAAAPSRRGKGRKAPAAAPAAPAVVPAGRPKLPCRFFQIGTCSKGAGCTFSHDAVAGAVALAAPCKFWVAGTCAHGQKCAFRHGKAAPAPRPAAAPPRPPPTAAPPPRPPAPAPPSAGLAALRVGVPPPRAGVLYPPPRAPQIVAPFPVEGGHAAFPRDSGPEADGAAGIAPTAAERAAAAALSCGVCLEPVLAKRGRFGVLEGCDHAFCLQCIREWRSTHAIRPEVARACPECRAPSHFVVPSTVHVAGERKRALVRAYLAGLRAVPCRHFAHGEGTCPFGTSCFYAHTDRAGKPIAHAQPRMAYGKAGGTSLPSYQLSDYLFPVACGGEGVLDSIPVVPHGEARPQADAEYPPLA